MNQPGAFQLLAGLARRGWLGVASRGCDGAMRSVRAAIMKV
jgi:hypothetical protein